MASNTAANGTRPATQSNLTRRRFDRHIVESLCKRMDHRHYYVSLGSKAIHLQALQHDVRRLMVRFQAVAEQALPGYLKVWQELNFSLVHFGCLEKAGREPMMSALFRTVLEYFTPQASLDTQLSVLYALYLLYFTQPKLFDFVPIAVDMPMFSRLEDLFEHCLDHDWDDAVYVYNSLVAQGGISVCARVNPCLGYIASKDLLKQYLVRNALIDFIQDWLRSARTLQSAADSGTVSSLNGEGTHDDGNWPADQQQQQRDAFLDQKLQDIAKRYEEYKQVLSACPEVRQASHQLYTQTLGIEPSALATDRDNPDWEFSGLALETEPDHFPTQLRDIVLNHYQKRNHRWQALIDPDSELPLTGPASSHLSAIPDSLGDTPSQDGNGADEVSDQAPIPKARKTRASSRPRAR
ncbi:hypothetical protein H4R35_005137 [Dimargaris xerosporica]|nr:hypothetical protein H4R35_005137 [Dimargaris xerosporica]